MADEADDWLRVILKKVELEQFYSRLVDELQITQIQHFNFVETSDLEKIGLAKPAARRLLEAVKKYKSSQKKLNVLNKIIPGSNSSSFKHNNLNRNNVEVVLVNNGLTCLIQEKDITQSVVLGDGNFGVVRKGEWRTPSGKIEPVAVKTLKQEGLSEPGIVENFLKEVQVMHQLDEPHLIRLFGVILTRPMMMVTELANLGSLRDYLLNKCPRVSVCVLWEYALQVATGMSYLEQKRFVHRDLACRNVLLCTINKVKIGDFGLMRIVPNESDCYIMTERMRVPIPWCAPESLKLKQFSHASDVWMYAVTLWEMFTFGEVPWAGLTSSEIVNRVDKRGERLPAPNACPSILYSLMMECWNHTPTNRPTFSKIRTFLLESPPLVLKATDYYREANKDCINVDRNDKVTVIEGCFENYLWKIQNQRTFEIGMCPRCILNNGMIGCKKLPDISTPREFLHTGHGGTADTASWGHPGKIDGLHFGRHVKNTQRSNIKLSTVSAAQQFRYRKMQNDISASNNGHTESNNSQQNLVNVEMLLDLNPPPLDSTLIRSSTVCILDQPIGQELDGVLSNNHLISPNHITEGISMHVDPFDTSCINANEINNKNNLSANDQSYYNFEHTRFSTDLPLTVQTNLEFSQKKSDPLYPNYSPNLDENILKRTATSFPSNSITTNASTTSPLYYNNIVLDVNETINFLDRLNLSDKKQKDSDAQNNLLRDLSTMSSDNYDKCSKIPLSTELLNMSIAKNTKMQDNQIDDITNIFTKKNNIVVRNNSPDIRDRERITNNEQAYNYSSVAGSSINSYTYQDLDNDISSGPHPYQHNYPADHRRMNIEITSSTETNSPFYDPVADVASHYRGGEMYDRTFYDAVAEYDYQTIDRVDQCFEELDPGKKDKVAWLSADMRGSIPQKDCISALNIANWDIPSASRYLLTQKLVALKIAPQHRCEQVLKESHWNLDVAASRLLES